MNTQKRIKLEEKGWKFGTVQEYLNLSPEENNYIEVKLALSKGLQCHLANQEWLKWRREILLCQLICLFALSLI
jgi:hypothetical protein